MVAAPMPSGKPRREKSGALTVGFGSELNSADSFGPELGFGITMYEHLQEPILIIKTAWGGRSLIKDFRPPSSLAIKPKSGGTEEDSKKSDEEWLSKNAEKEAKKWKLTTQELIELRKTQQGRYYRKIVECVKQVLADPGKYHPAYSPAAGYEIAGFVWFQGFNDLVSGRNYDRDYGGHGAYGDFLACLIRDLRKDISAPDMPVVIGVMGIGGMLNDIKE